MASVYLSTEISAFDPLDPYKSFIALKQLFPKYSAQRGFVKCLVDEAKLTSLLKHPNIVEVHDLGNVGTDFYLTMDWVNGKSMHQLLDMVRNQNKVISKSFLFYVFQNIAKGLHYAHEMKDSANRPLNIVHCDISPQNILLSYEGDVKLSDFGIATAEKSKERALSEALLGKLPYMAPEQITMKGFDRRVDIYSFGVLMYESLTGKKPLDSASMQDLQRKIVKEEPSYSSKVFQNFPKVKEFIQACLAKNPADRPSTIAEFFTLQHETEDVDQIKISKLMKLLFQSEIRKEKESIHAATQIFISMMQQSDLLGDEGESSFLQEKSVFRPTEVVHADAFKEMTKVLLPESEKENVGKVMIQKQEVIRVIKKTPIEEEWIDKETTQRRMSKEMIEATEVNIKETKSLNDVFDSDEQSSFTAIPQAEKTVVDFNRSLEKSWSELQQNLRSKNTGIEPSEEQTREISLNRSDSGLVEIDRVIEKDFEPAYPKTGEVVDFSKMAATNPEREIHNDKVIEMSENETKEARIQLKLTKKPLLVEKNSAETPATSNLPAEKSTGEGFLDEMSRSNESEIPPLKFKTSATPTDAFTFQIRKRTMGLIFITTVIVLMALFSNKMSFMNFFAIKTFDSANQVQIVNMYISVEEFRDTQKKSSTSLWMSSEFQKSFMSPIQHFLETQHTSYTKKEALPFRFVFGGFERGTPKIPWQGGLFNAYLPFEKFFELFEIKNSSEDKRVGRLFIHLYSKQINTTTEYPIDYQGDRPVHAGVLYYPMFSESENEFQLRLTHEILHMLGAKDLYNNKGLPKYPEGYVEPLKDPLHPQQYGEIMSRTIPQNPSEYIPLSSLEDARVGAYTAYQIGWITEQEMNRYYQR